MCVWIGVEGVEWIRLEVEHEGSDDEETDNTDSNNGGSDNAGINSTCVDITCDCTGYSVYTI